jgi:tetratricopeptide (TPR) repeat protein
MLDGKPACSGQRISLGSHQFTVTHPKGETFTTNLFIWYGKHDLGNIDLKRAKGMLSIRVDPPVPLLSIQGPEFSVTLTNSTGFSDSVPTDQYTVEAQYRHWQKGQTVTVYENSPGTLTIAPQLGALVLTCNQDGATYQLTDTNGNNLESGEFPPTLVELPAGNYKLMAWHHGHRWLDDAPVASGMTNRLQVEFKYGTAVLETVPSGASVTGSDGHYWGVTPLKITELQPGTWSFNLRLDNYEPVTASLDVIAYDAATFSTNLISQSYTGAMRAARQAMNAANYDLAIELLGDALRSNPGDLEAGLLLNESTAYRCIHQAEALGKNGDYIAGEAELDKALAALPDNGKTKQMLAEFKRHEPEQLEQMRVERLNRPRSVYNEALARYADASLFNDHEMKTSKAARDVAAAIVKGLQNAQPPFRVTQNNSPKPETFEIEAMLELPGLLGEGTTSGRRQCVIVCGQTKDDETQILFKVLEYKAETTIKFSVANLLNTATTDNVKYIPLNPSRLEMTDKLQAQLAEGASNVITCVQNAIN